MPASIEWLFPPPPLKLIKRSGGAIAVELSMVVDSVADDADIESFLKNQSGLRCSIFLIYRWGVKNKLGNVFRTHW